MIYLYAGLGIAILTGINTIFQFSNNLIQNNGYMIFKQDEYMASKAKQMDRIIIKILNEKKDIGDREDICLNLNLKLNQSGYSQFSEYDYITGNNSPSSHNDLQNSCALTNGSHRVIIKRKEKLNYILFSCILKDKKFCSFELS